MSEWISVKDRLPDEGQKVLTCLIKDEEYMINDIIHFEIPIWACVLEREEYKVTHWMLLPEAPKVIDESDYNYI